MSLGFVIYVQELQCTAETCHLFSEHVALFVTLNDCHIIIKIYIYLYPA